MQIHSVLDYQIAPKSKPTLHVYQPIWNFHDKIHSENSFFFKNKMASFLKWLECAPTLYFTSTHWFVQGRQLESLQRNFTRPKTFPLFQNFSFQTLGSIAQRYKTSVTQAQHSMLRNNTPWRLYNLGQERIYGVWFVRKLYHEGYPA